MKNDDYMKTEDIAELLSEPVENIRKWAEEKNKSPLIFNGMLIESGKVIKINDVADTVNIPIKTIKKWAKEKNKPLLNCKEMPIETDRFQSIKGISEKLGIPVKTIKNWVNAEKIPHYWAGGTFLRFKTSEVIEWANNKGYISMFADIK